MSDSPPRPWPLVDAVCSPFYRLTVGTASLLLGSWALKHWVGWEQGYDFYFWSWVFSLLGLWLSPQLPQAKPADVLCVLILGAAITLRCWRLFTLPGDSGNRLTSETFSPFIDMAEIHLLEQGRYPNVFHTRWGVWLVPSWVMTVVTGDYVVGFRSMAAFWGALALAGTAMLARSINSPALAYSALIVLGLNWWDNSANRQHPIMAAAAGAAWAWWAIWRACSTRRIADAILAGIIGGLALRLYEPVKVVLVTAPIWWLFHAVVTPGFLRRTWHVPLIVGAVGYMTLWPVIYHGGNSYFFEAQTNAMLGGEHLHGEFDKAPLQHMMRILSVVTGNRFDPLVNAFVNIPMFNFLELGLMAIGLLAMCWRWRDPTATMTPLWIAVTCLAVSVSSQPEAGRRLVAMMPAVGILAGTGLLLIYRWRRPWGLLVCVAILGFDAYLNWHAFFSWAASADQSHLRQ